MNTGMIALVFAGVAMAGLTFMVGEAIRDEIRDRRNKRAFQRDDAELRGAVGDDRPALRIVLGSGGIR